MAIDTETLEQPATAERDAEIDAAMAQQFPADDKPDDTEHKSGDDVSTVTNAAEPEKLDEDQPSPADAAPEWIDDDVKTLVSTFGITDETLKKFPNREAFDLAVSLLDAQVLQAGKTKPAEKTVAEEKVAAKTDESPRNPDGTFSKQPEGAEGIDALKVLSEFKLDPEGLGADDAPKIEAVVASAATALKQMQSRLELLESAEAGRVAKFAETQFDTAVDALDQAELFGKTGSETPEQKANRDKVFNSDYMIGLELMGHPGRSNPALVRRAFQLEFADHIIKQTKRQQTSRFREQSGQRLGSGATTRPEGDWKGPVEDDPELLALEKHLQKRAAG